MTEIIQLALYGVALGAMYSLTAQGIILVYRGSGVLNFSQGAIGLTGAYVYYELHIVNGLPVVAAVAGGVVVAAAFGGLIHLVVMRPLARASSLARVVATLGILTMVQAAVVLRYGSAAIPVPVFLPDQVIHLTDGASPIAIGLDRLLLLAIAAVVTVVLWLVYKRTVFGLATEAVVENQRSAAELGWSPDLIAVANWTIGSALAGLAAILIVPIATLQVNVVATLVLSSLAVALVAGFASFPRAFAAGLGLGVIQSELARYGSDVPGLSASVPFIVVIVFLSLRGRALPLRGDILDRLPAIGTGRIPVPTVAACSAVAVLAISQMPPQWASATTSTLIAAIILLSFVVLTGYSGQLSLAQFTLAGLGAYAVGRLDAVAGLPLPLAFVLGVAVAVPIALVFALPAVRVRGVNLAIVTLGLGSTIEAMLFNNTSYTGGDAGTPLSRPRFFGVDLSATAGPSRYAVVVLAWFVALAVVLANLRRSRVGRRLIAIRSNERAAAALGIDVAEGKLFAFGLSGAVAAIGGTLLAYQTDTVVYSTFTNAQSIVFVVYAVIGGVGFLAGPLLGGMLAAGGLGSLLGEEMFGADFSSYLPMLAGFLLVRLLTSDPNGLASIYGRALRGIMGRVRPGRARPSGPPPVLRTPAARQRVAAASLTLHDVSVRFGGIVAVDEVSLQVRTGRVVGLLGPNGAGKTTVVDVISGLVPPSGGDLLLDGRSILGRPPAWRARAGVVRSFQSLELFEDMTVAENLLAASEPRDRLGYLTTLVRPGSRRLTGATAAAVEEFGLADDLHRPVGDLPYGKRRLVGIARSVATSPSFLLLDEPAAGLSEHESSELAGLVRRLVDEWGLGVLLIEHDMRFVMNLCDELCVLNFGRVISHGPPEVVRREPEVIAAYLGDDPDHEASGSTWRDVARTR